MGEVTALGIHRDFFADARGSSRQLRVTCHPADGLTVLSFWQGSACVATFQLPDEEVARLITLLAGQLAANSAPAVRAPRAGTGA
jgi:hypothetical protein